MITLKNLQEIRKIEYTCRVAAKVLREIAGMVRPGIATRELEKQIVEWIRKRDCRPSFLGYRDYPSGACTSINEEVVHGIPGMRKLREGDIVGIDVGVVKDGFFGDAAVTFSVGNTDDEKRRLMKVTKDALATAIEVARVGNRISDISHAVERTVTAEGFQPVRALVGHGVGKAVHEEPQIPNFGAPGKGPRIQDGMVLAIEPMINAGSYEVYTEADGWTVVTEDGRPSAHFEHTVAVVNGRAEILTQAD